jgi:hypothetical protein
LERRASSKQDHAGTNSSQQNEIRTLRLVSRSPLIPSYDCRLHFGIIRDTEPKAQAYRAEILMFPVKPQDMKQDKDEEAPVAMS